MTYLAVIGPTCSGKTAYTQETIDASYGRINLDSFQLYDFFSLGTGRSDKSTGHLYGVLDPHVEVTGQLYLDMVAPVLGKMATHDVQPVFEGGSLRLLKALASQYTLSVVGIRPPHNADVGSPVERRIAAVGQDNLIKEAHEGLQRGYRDTTVMRDDVVYLPLVRYLDHDITRGEAFERIHGNLVNMHNRQMAAYLEMPDITWVEQ